MFAITSAAAVVDAMPIESLPVFFYLNYFRDVNWAFSGLVLGLRFRFVFLTSFALLHMYRTFFLVNYICTELSIGMKSQ